MRNHVHLTLRLLRLLTLLGLFLIGATAAEVLTPCFLKVSIYTNIPGTTVANLTDDPSYPASPGQIRFLRSFNTRDALPTDALETFGGRIEGFLTPQQSGDYHFFIRSDDSSQLWLSTDDKEINASMIAEEPDSGDAFLEPEINDPSTSQPVTLTAGTRYFIMVLYKSSALAGNSTDYAKVAWRMVGDTTPAASLDPIPGAFLSTLADNSSGPAVTITQHPQSATGEENSKLTFSVAATALPTNYVCIQWQRNGINIPGATGTNYTRFLDKADNGAKIRAVVAVPGALTNSDEATITVTDDKTPPVLLGAKGGPNRPEVALTFSERLSVASAGILANYKIVTTGAGGAMLGVTEAVLSADGTVVTLKTDAQNPGTNYTVTVNNLTDRAQPTPNVIAATNQAAFLGRGPWLQGVDGFVVWEAEDYDRNLDGLWVRDTERGVASGGVSMVNNNGAGGSENDTKLEYDIFFTKTGTNIIWWRFSGNDGNDDSAFFHLDGARPVNREAGNLAALGGTGTALTGAWGWTTTPFEGGGQMTFVIDTPGVHSIAIARREDGSFVDRFVITTDPNFVPTTGFTALGPSVTQRQGEPAPIGASASITRHPASIIGIENTSITLTSAVTLPPGFLFTYRWQRKQGNDFVDIPGATLTTLTLNPLQMSWNGAVVRMRVTVAGDVQFTDEATITVTPETTVPSLVRVTGLAGEQQVAIVFSEPVTPATAQNIANYKIEGASGSVAVQSAAVMPNGRSVVLGTAAQTVGTKYTVTVNGVADTAAVPNIIPNQQAKFFSLGALLPQGEDGLLVFEAESYSVNMGEIWIVDRLRGTPSSGASVVAPAGSGSAEVNSVEYELIFTKTGTNILWYRASGNDGGDDSAWVHLDGARPPTRTTGNQASMTGFSGQLDFVWRSQPQDGGGQMTLVIPTAGAHTIGLALREDGAFFDKFVISTNPTFNPSNYGTFGPPETRAGGLPLPSLAISSPAANAQYTTGVEIPIAPQISSTTRVITKVEYFRGTTKIGETTTSPYDFTWLNAPLGTNNVSARLTDDVNDSVQSLAVAVIVTAPPEIRVTAAAGPGGLALNWSGGTAPYTLQKKIQLSDAAWVEVLTTSNTSTTVPLDDPSGFYRIRTP